MYDKNFSRKNSPLTNNFVRQSGLYNRDILTVNVFKLLLFKPFQLLSGKIEVPKFNWQKRGKKQKIE